MLLLLSYLHMSVSLSDHPSTMGPQWDPNGTPMGTPMGTQWEPINTDRISTQTKYRKIVIFSILTIFSPSGDSIGIYQGPLGYHWGVPLGVPLGYHWGTIRIPLWTGGLGAAHPCVDTWEAAA